MAGAAVRRPARRWCSGLTFKENVPDLRNSRSVDVVRRLKWLGHEVDVADPLASAAEVEREYGLALDRAGRAALRPRRSARCQHRQYREMTAAELGALVAPGRHAGRPQGHVARAPACARSRPLDPVTGRQEAL